MLPFPFRFFLAFLFASFACAADVVTPSSLHPGLTRTEADASLPKDYQWQVLSDKTVRRMWRYADRAVLADFDPQTDQCVFLSLVYPKGIGTHEGLMAASELVQGSELQLKKLGKSKEKALQMQNADFGELPGGSYLFVEKRKDGSIIRISWYRLPPASSRLTLTAMTQVDKTLMGSRGDEGILNSLIADERRRQGTIKPGAAQEGGGRPRPVIMTADGYVPDYDRTEGKPKKRVKVQLAQAERLKTTVAGLEPVHWAIAGLVLLLLVGWCVASSRK